MSNRKIIALYYPQYHPIPLNDKYWGNGFTDWVNIKKAKPLFAGHYQPKVPKGSYYDPRDIETLKSQSELAKKYGVYGFCFYHYWFDGFPLLEQPILNFLSERNIDIPFCLSWANETWTKRWIGDSKTVIIKQNHIPNKELWKKHFYYLLPFFKDNRAIKIDGKPVFLIFQPFIIKKVNKMIKYWQELAVNNGLNGIYFIATKRHDYFPKNSIKMFSGIMKFQPSNAKNSNNFSNNSYFKNIFLQKIRGFGERFIDILYYYKKHFEGIKYIDSNDIWDTILQEVSVFENDKKRVFECAFVNWDNTARYGEKATVFSHITPNLFEQKLDQLFLVLEKRSAENVIFINAWNEWAEGAYLEPDEKYGYAYLEALNNVISKCLQ